MGSRSKTAAVGFVAFVGVTGIVAAVFSGSLRVELSVPETSAESATEVPFEISVCSNSPVPMTTDDGKPLWRIVDAANGKVIADSSHYVFTLELKRLTWGPRSCRTVAAEVWDQRTWNQPGDVAPEVLGTPARGDLVPPGRYRIEAGWNGVEQQSVEVEITG